MKLGDLVGKPASGLGVRFGLVGMARKLLYTGTCL